MDTKKESSSATPARGIDFRTADDFVSRYANNVFFEASLYDLKLIFGQSDLRDGQNAVSQHTAVTLPWPQVKVGLYFLANQLAAYEAYHGRIVIEPGIILPVGDAPPKDPNWPEDIVRKIWTIASENYKRFIKDNPEAAPVQKPNK